MSELTLKVGGSKREFKLDNGRAVWLDPSDQGIVSRYSQFLRSIEGMEAEFKALAEIGKQNSDDESKINDFADKHEALDRKMREALNEIFDSDVADTCAGRATMFDIMPDGIFRFEQIIEGLMVAYTSSIKEGYEASRKRIDKAKGDRGHVRPPNNRRG